MRISPRVSRRAGSRAVDDAESGDARRALREFKQTFGAAAATLPLVRLDVNNWAEPFVQV